MTLKLLIMNVRWTSPAPATTQATIQGYLNDLPALFSEISYGALSFSGTATPWMLISAPTDPVAQSLPKPDLYGKAMTAARAAGIEPNDYDVWGVCIPSAEWTAVNGAGVSQTAYVSFNTPSILFSVESFASDAGRARMTVIHETLHTQGLRHANATFCTNGATTPIQTNFTVNGNQVRIPLTFSSNNTEVIEYSNDYSVMGTFYGTYPAQLDPWDKVTLGWLQGRYVGLIKGGSVALQPRTTQTAGTAAAVVNVSPHRSYWFEYITATGSDAGMATESRPAGVYVTVLDRAIPDIGPGGTGAAMAVLVDTHPVAAGAVAPADSWVNAGMVGTDTWTSPEGYIFTVSGITGTSATLAVS